MSWDFQALFNLYAKEIARSLRRKGLNPETAADLTQDTFLRVIARPPADGAPNHNPRAYLHQVSHSLTVNHLRREALLPLVDLAEGRADEVADPAPLPDRIVYSRQCLAQVAAALDELPERTRAAFEMHRLGGHTLAEVAATLGLSTTRTWALVREAYRHLLLRVDDE